MKTKVVPLRIPESLDSVAALSAQNEHTDKATALRQWLHEGAALYMLRLVSEGRLSMSRAAELLDVSMFDLYGLVEKYHIEIGATQQQREQSFELVKQLSQKEKTA